MNLIFAFTSIKNGKVCICSVIEDSRLSVVIQHIFVHGLGIEKCREITVFFKILAMTLDKIKNF